MENFIDETTYNLFTSTFSPFEEIKKLAIPGEGLSNVIVEEN